MRYPKFLQGGGRIGFIAPSFGCSTEPYKSLFIAAQERFAKLGYGLVLGPNAYAEAGIGKSNTPELCGAEINDFFLNDRSDAIISCGGGETMCEDLPFVDFDAISKAEPKWYMGYSDNTHMTFLLPTLLDTAAIYGPCGPEFGMRFWDESLSDAFRLLTGEQYSFTSYDKWEREGHRGAEHPLASFRKKKDTAIISENWDGKPISGRFIGGCLDILEMYPGTKNDRVKQFAEHYKEDGIIWFIEACDLNTLSMSRVLWHLRNAGWFKHVKAFLVGRPAWFEDASWGLTHYEAVMREVRRIEAEEEKETGVLRKIPVIMDFPIGHLKPMVPMVSGGFGTISRLSAPKGTQEVFETLDDGSKALFTRTLEEKLEITFQRK